MIRRAITGPTPGRASSSACSAVLILMRPGRILHRRDGLAYNVVRPGERPQLRARADRVRGALADGLESAPLSRRGTPPSVIHLGDRHHVESPSQGIAAAVRGAGGADHTDGPTAGFTEAPVATGLSSPTAMEFAPDGRLVRARTGGERRVRPERRHDLDRPPPGRRLAGRTRPARHRVRPRVRVEPLRLPVLHQPGCRRCALGHGRAQPAQPVHRRRLRPDPTDLHRRGPDPRLGQPERGHQPQRGRDPLRPRWHALRRRRRQRADLHPRGEHLPGLADPLRPPGQAAPHRRRRVQPAAWRRATTPRSGT